MGTLFKTLLFLIAMVPTANAEFEYSLAGATAAPEVSRVLEDRNTEERARINLIRARIAAISDQAVRGQAERILERIAAKPNPAKRERSLRKLTRLLSGDSATIGEKLRRVSARSARIEADARRANGATDLDPRGTEVRNTERSTASERDDRRINDREAYYRQMLSRLPTDCGARANIPGMDRLLGDASLTLDQFKAETDKRIDTYSRNSCGAATAKNRPLTTECTETRNRDGSISRQCTTGPASGAEQWSKMLAGLIGRFGTQAGLGSGMSPNDASSALMQYALGREQSANVYCMSTPRPEECRRENLREAAAVRAALDNEILNGHAIKKHQESPWYKRTYYTELGW